MVVVDYTQANTNVWPRVAADKQGIPHLCVSFGILMYITLADHQWVKQPIDPVSGTISYHCSIAVVRWGTPCGLVPRTSAGWKAQYIHFRDADLENGVWVVRSVDGGLSGKWSSMAIDSKGFPHATIANLLAAGS